MFSRRRIITAAAWSAAGHALAPWMLGQAVGAEGGLRITSLGSAANLISGAGTNILAVADDDGVVLVDGGLAEHSEALLDAVAEAFDGRPVRTLFNTHWHPEQTGANRLLARDGATLVSQVNTRLWLSTDIQRPWEDFTHQPLPPEALPTRTFFDQGSEITLNGKALRYGHLLQAHTDGDAFVYFPEQDILACGGVIAGDRWPLIDWWTGGWLGGLVEGIETLLQVAGEQTVILPAEGPPLSRAELAAQRDMYADLFVRFRDELLFQGLSPAEAVAAAPTAGLRENWPRRDEFVTLAFQSLWGFYAPDV